MSEYFGPVDALADELLVAIRDFPVDRPFSQDPARGEPERRLCEAYNRLYCVLHDLVSLEEPTSEEAMASRVLIQPESRGTDAFIVALREPTSEAEEVSECAVARNYIARTLTTVRNHRDAENCWPQWANIFADEIERLWKIEDKQAALKPDGEASEAAIGTGS